MTSLVCANAANSKHRLRCNDRKELDQLITLAQIGLILPLHTADCERTFSQQNKILTKSRANLSSKHLHELIRVRLFTKSGSEVSTERVFAMWKASKNRNYMLSFKCYNYVNDKLTSQTHSSVSVCPLTMFD